jgi:hypothetical protein
LCKRGTAQIESARNGHRSVALAASVGGEHEEPLLHRNEDQKQ